MVPRGAIVTDDSQAWPALVRSALADRIVERERTGFATPAPAAWDRGRLQALAADIPPDFRIERIDRSNIASFLVVAEDFASNWRSLDAYLERGLGFGVFDATHCVAGCSSFTLANNKLEIEIDTDPEYRRLGLARAVAARLILHCLEHGIEPCWDAHNPESAALALQLGFVNPEPYTVFVVS
jgi:GNAT superfamily N-acetyltransferase